MCNILELFSNYTLLTTFIIQYQNNDIGITTSLYFIKTIITLFIIGLCKILTCCIVYTIICILNYLLSVLSSLLYIFGFIVLILAFKYK